VGNPFEHQRGDVEHDSGAQIVCLESMNHDDLRPDFSDKITASHRVRQQVRQHALAGVAHVKTTLALPERTSPTTETVRPRSPGQRDRRVGGAGVEGHHHAQPAVKDAHHLVGAHLDRGAGSRRRSRVSRSSHVDDGVEVLGQEANDVAEYSPAGDVRHGVQRAAQFRAAPSKLSVRRSPTAPVVRRRAFATNPRRPGSSRLAVVTRIVRASV
jgi:hypothetical protein